MSNIDFRSYSAAFHYSNDDLMHFGIKGMKWHHHKRPMRSLSEWFNGGDSEDWRQGKNCKE